MVQGLTAYIVACGPRTNGSSPGSVSVAGNPARSCAVYSGLTTSESGVCQFSDSSGAPRNDSSAAAAHTLGSVVHLSAVHFESDISAPRGAIDIIVSRQLEKSAAGCAALCLRAAV